MQSQLRKFLTDPAFSIERERLLHISAVRELKLYAAVHGRRIMITEPELDIEGFDFAMSSDFDAIHLQSKGTLRRGGRNIWSVRAALIRPSFYDRDLMPDMDGQKVGGYSTGGTGGVVIHVVDEDAADEGQLQISYRYLDVFWLIGVASGIAGRAQKDRERALSLLRQMREADDEQRVELRVSDFAQLNSITDIAFLRLHVGGSSNWASLCRLPTDLSILGDPVNQHLSALWPGRAFVR